MTPPTDPLRAALAEALLAHPMGCFEYEKGGFHDSPTEDCATAILAHPAVVAALAESPAPGLHARAWNIVEATARMGLCSQTHHEYLARDARGVIDSRNRAATPTGTAEPEGLRKHLHDTLATIAFLRSVVASGERLSDDDESRMREVYESARDALAVTDRDALRKALDIIEDLPRIADDDGGEWVRLADVRSVIVSQGVAALAGSGPEPNWSADVTGHCPCGGQCHHNGRPCSESCVDANKRAGSGPEARRATGVPWEMVVREPHDASIVYITRRSFTLNPPGKMTYHRPSRHRRHSDRTGCGIDIWSSGWEPVELSSLIAVRRDVASRVARPCGKCGAD